MADEAIRNLTVKFKAEPDPSLTQTANAMGAAALEMEKRFKGSLSAIRSDLGSVGHVAANVLASMAADFEKAVARIHAAGGPSSRPQPMNQRPPMPPRANQAEPTIPDSVASNGAGGKRATRELAAETVAAEKIRRDAIGATNRALEDHQRRIEEIRKLESKGRLAPEVAQQAREHSTRRYMQQVETIRKRETAPQDRAAREAERDEERKWAAVNKQDARQFAARMKIISDREKAEKKASEASAKQITADEKAKEQAVARSAREYEGAQARVRAANMMAVESGKQLLEGVTSLARGFVLLTAANEDDAQKMLKMLAGFEAVAQSVRGVINIVQSVSRMYQTYQAAVKGATVAQVALAAAEAASGKAALAGAAQRAVAGGASGVSNLAGGAAGAAGIGGGAGIAGVAGAVAPWVAAIGGSVAALVALKDAAENVSKYGFGGGAAPGSYTERVASAEAKGLTWAAGKMPDLTSIFGSGPKAQLAQMLVGPANPALTPFYQAARSNQALTRAEQGRARVQQAVARGEALYERSQFEGESEEQLAAIRRDREARERERQARRAGYRPEAREQIIARRESAETERAAYEREAIQARAEGGPLAREREERARREVGRLAAESSQSRREQVTQQTMARSFARGETAAATADYAERSARVADLERQLEQARSAPMRSEEKIGDLTGKLATARQGMEAAANRQTAAVEKEKNVVHQINQERLQTAERNIQRTQEEISLRRQILDAEKERLRSAKVGFGQMTEAEQEQTWQAWKKAESQGAKSLTREESGILRRANLRATTEAANQADEERTKQFFARRGTTMEATMARPEARNIEQQQAAMQERLELRLKDERQLKVNVEMDIDRMVNQTVDRVSRILDENTLVVERLIEQGLSRRQNQWNQEFQKIGSAQQTSRPY